MMNDARLRTLEERIVQLEDLVEQAPTSSSPRRLTERFSAQRHAACVCGGRAASRSAQRSTTALLI